MYIEFDELERAAYMAGDEQTLKLLARIADLEGEVEAAEERADEAERDASGAFGELDDLQYQVAELEGQLAYALETISELKGE